MILIEQDAKPLLMERLDECLKVHADMLDAQNIGSIYELQGLSELHYYLKVEHVFTPAEVEALLSFQDPLDVARWCWEENNHEHSFPICDLLKEIDAEQKFEHFTSEASAQLQSISKDSQAPAHHPTFHPRTQTLLSDRNTPPAWL